MNEKYVVALIAFSGVLLSGIISFIISKITIRVKVREIKEDYSKNLHKERLKYYPKLYEITGGIGTLFNTNPNVKSISKKELSKYLDRLIEWDEKYAIFGGPIVMKKLFNSRRRLEETVIESKKVELKKLYEALQELEFEIKKEIGVFTSERFDTIEQNREESYGGYEKRFDEYRLIQ